MPGNHRSASRSWRRFFLTAAVFALAVAGIAPAGAASGDGYQFEIGSGGVYAFAQERQDDADSSMQALVEVYLDGDWAVTGSVTNADPGIYTVAVGVAGTCAGNTELFDFEVLTEPAVTPMLGMSSPSLPAGHDFIRIYKKGTACQTVWASSIPEAPLAIITAPSDGSVNHGAVSLGVDYYDNDFDPVLWAVRNGTCDANTNTVAGNVDGFSTAYAWDGRAFSASIDGLDAGHYCFVFNTEAQGGDDGVRETRWFYIADASVSGGGQLRADSDDPKKPYKVSFGGWLYRIGPEEGDYLCEWTVQLHDVSIDPLDGAKFKAATCSRLSPFEAYRPPQVPEADGVVNFYAHGTLDGVPTTAIFRMEDFGEPASSQSIEGDSVFDADTLRIEFWQDGTLVYDTSPYGGVGGDFPMDSNNDGAVRAFLDKGNIQIRFFD